MGTLPSSQGRDLRCKHWIESNSTNIYQGGRTGVPYLQSLVCTLSI